MIWVGLTGGIASGKSTVSRFLCEAGAAMIDADQIAHDLIRQGGCAYQPVVEVFGRQILDATGEIDRKRLGQIVFADAASRARLNLLVHPPLFEVVQAKKQEIFLRDKRSVIVFDAPLLIETDAYREMDWVLLAYVDRGEQVARLIQRDGLTEDEANRRIDSQILLEDKVSLVDEVIDTRRPLVDLQKSVQETYHRLKEKATGHTGRTGCLR